MDEAIHQPHDKLFTTAFGVPENTAAFLSAKLPEAISSRIDWNGLAHLPGSFVDNQYRRSHTDLLFSVPFDGSEILPTSSSSTRAHAIPGSPCGSCATC